MASQPVALVVDDEPTVRLLMGRALRIAGFVVEEAENGQAALKLFPRVAPDVILVDAQMPEIDGLEVCRRVRSMPGGARLPIVLISGMLVDELRPQAIAAGATDILGKPIQVLTLGRQMRALLDPEPAAPSGP